MSKSTGHNFDGLFKKSFNIPDSLDLHKAQNSFQNSSKGKTEPVLFRMDRQKARDNAIYPLAQ